MARDGTADMTNYLSVADSAGVGPDITGTAFSAHLWCNLDTNNASRTFFGKRGTPAAANTIQYELRHNSSGVLFCAIGDSSSFDQATGSGAITTGAWHPIGMRKDGTGAASLIPFRDGAPSGAGVTSTRSIQHRGDPLFVDTNSTTIENGVDGKLAELAVWDVALSDAEFAALASGVSPLSIRRDHLRGYWPLMGVALATEADLSGQGRHLSQTGSLALVNHAPVGRFSAMPK